MQASSMRDFVGAHRVAYQIIDRVCLEIFRRSKEESRCQTAGIVSDRYRQILRGRKRTRLIRTALFSEALAIFRKSWSTTHKSSDVFVLSLR